ncbi:hypothetical protein GCM10025779_17060 [Arthrobacter cryoconiti]
MFCAIRRRVRLIDDVGQSVNGAVDAELGADDEEDCVGFRGGFPSGRDGLLPSDIYLHVQLYDHLVAGASYRIG